MSPTRVDEAMVRFGMADGPLEHLDLMGLDVAARLVKTLEPVLTPRIPLDSAFGDMVQRQWLGQKAGLGFYRYRGRRHKENQALTNLLRAESQATPHYRMDALSIADQLALARERLVWLTVNEAARCLEEGLAENAGALDLALMLAGWAPHRGGPLHYARHVGIDRVIVKLQELAQKHGPRYEPCRSLPGV
jgi:3-hydroxyacyl-CoA dehydrogenase/enoyl-CoA hydratase/3-hydroxybutyryl-CoA epimerase